MIQVVVEFTWKHVGAVVLDESDALRFPVVPAAAGLYKFTIGDGVYIGEAAYLQRRMQHYRTPGPNQKTNRRMNQLMVKHLGADGKIGLDIASEAVVAVDGVRRDADLDSKSERVLVEHAAIVAVVEAGTTCLNRAIGSA